jgi:hypothetical protein
MKLALVVLALLVMGSNCDPEPAPPLPGNDYCENTAPSPSRSLFGSEGIIMGGTPSADRRATAFVQLGSTGHCSGTVVSAHTVLTAAHCWSEEMGVQIEGQSFEATGKLVHPAYQNAPYNDLLLLYFDENTLPGPYVSAVYSHDSADSCDMLVAQGWGQNEDNTLDLRESRYAVVNEMTKTLHTKQLTPGGICFGDSGGPLYALVNGELQIAGVTSVTYSNDCMIGSGHVNLAHYKTWFEDNIQ